MTHFDRISAEQVSQKLASGPATLIDIRDKTSFGTGHINAAHHIDNQGVATFLDEADKALPLIVYCYHGNSSQSAARFFAEQGFVEVYSMDGGFEAWRTLFPGTIDSDS